MKTENYTGQLGRWPKTGRHIMAQYDDRGIIVYLGADAQSATLEVK